MIFKRAEAKNPEGGAWRRFEGPVKVNLFLFEKL